MVDLWARMTTAAPRFVSSVPKNFKRWEAEIAWILAHRMFTGVRCNIGISDPEGIGNATGTINTEYIEYLCHRLASNGLKLQLGLGGEGPNRLDTDWITLNGGSSWLTGKRPSFGNGNTDVIDRIVAIKQSAIDVMYDVYTSYGLNPYEYCFIELGNEPAIGSSGAPTNDTMIDNGPAFYALFGITYSTSIGKWDSGYPAPADDYKGATIIASLTYEAQNLDFRGLRCIAPTFASEVLSVELGSDGFHPAGSGWVEEVRKKTELIFAINLYYSVFDQGSATYSALNYVWPTCGPHRYARIALSGWDGRGAKSQDRSCVEYKLALLRANATIGNSRIVCAEAGINYLDLGMDEPGMSTTTRTASYFINYRRNAEATLAYLDGLRRLGFEWVTLFTVSNATDQSGTPNQAYGVFAFLMSNEDIPDLQLDVTYTGALVWAARAGLPQTSLDLNVLNTSKGNYWLKQFKKGASENESLPQP